MGGGVYEGVKRGKRGWWEGIRGAGLKGLMVCRRMRGGESGRRVKGEAEEDSGGGGAGRGRTGGEAGLEQNSTCSINKVRLTTSKKKVQVQGKKNRRETVKK